eukprot:12090897-Prorocentrum_lima.AAC.1
MQQSVAALCATVEVVYEPHRQTGQQLCAKLCERRTELLQGCNNIIMRVHADAKPGSNPRPEA